MSETSPWNDLDNYASPVNPGIWKGVEEALIQRRRRKWIFWLSSIVLGTIAIIGFIYFSLPSKDNAGAQLPVATLESASEQHSPKILSQPNNTTNNHSSELLTLSEKSSVKNTLVDQPSTRSLSTGPVSTINPVTSAKASTITKESALVDQVINSSPSGKTDWITTLSNEYTFQVQSIQKEPFDRCRLPDPPIGCPGFGKRSRNSSTGRWAFDLTYGPGFPLRSLTAKSAEFNDYINLREVHESMVYDQAIQARISYITSWGLAARTGLHYGHTVEKFTLLRDSIIGSTTTITIDTLFNPDGSFTVTVDTNTVQTPGALDKRTYNHFRTLQIPLILGYEKRVGDWTFHINGGAMLNFLLRRRGEILNPIDQVVNIGSADGSYDAFQDQWGVLLTASLGANYRLTDRLHATIEPSVRHTLKSITSTTYPLDQKYTIINLNIGLRYEF